MVTLAASTDPATPLVCAATGEAHVLQDLRCDIKRWKTHHLPHFFQRAGHLIPLTT